MSSIPDLFDEQNRSGTLSAQARALELATVARQGGPYKTCILMQSLSILTKHFYSGTVLAR